MKGLGSQTRCPQPPALQSLPHAQVVQNVFSSSQQGVKRNRSMIVFYHSAHPSLRDTTSTKDLCGIFCSLLSCISREGFQERDLPSEMSRLLFIVHVGHLVGDVLQPRLSAFASGDHLGQLGADDGLRGEGFAEDFPLVHPLETFLDYASLGSDTTAGHNPPFVVEVT